MSESINVQSHQTAKQMIMTNLSGKTALVTGASRGMGRASALALAASGAQVLVHYGRGATEADGVVGEIRKSGGRADAVAADLAAADGPHKLAKLTRNIVGDRLDILVANAGISKSAPIEDHTIEDFDKLFAVNVRAPFFLVQQLLPILSKGSSIVFISSLGARAVVGRQCRGTWRRRDRYVELHQNGGGPGLRVGHAGVQAPGAARRHRRCRRLSGIRRCAMDHRRHHPRRWRVEALSRPGHERHGDGPRSRFHQDLFTRSCWRLGR